MKIPSLIFYLASLAIGLMSQPSLAQETNYILAKQSYNASKQRQYTVYKPNTVSGPAPLVMALHGCKQNENNVLNDFGLKAAADRFGFILVTPFITSYDGLRNENCWGFWFEQERHEGAGEVEDLVSIAKQVESNYNIDASQRYITGLSSGGAMTVVAAVAHNEYWAAAASVAGLPYGEDAASVSLSGQCPGYATFHDVSRVASDMNNELDSDRKIPLMVLAGSNDCTVLIQAAYNIRDAHLRVFGDSDSDTENEALQLTQDCSPFYQQNYGCQHKYYRNSAGETLVETVIHNGPVATANSQDTDHGHYWIGGEEGQEGMWAVRKGPSMPDIIWDFFNRHTMDCSGDSCPTIDKPICELIGDNPLDIAINTPFNDPGATCYDSLGSLPVNTDCNIDSSTVGDYQCTYSASNNNGATSIVRNVIVYDPDAPEETCITASSSPSDHISQGRAIAGGSYNLRAISTGDQADIGYAYDSWGNITLTEGKSGEWFAQEPQACRDSNPEPTPDCTDWFDSNLNHQYAGRAYYSMGYYTQGGNDSLGGLSGSYTWVYSDGTDYYAGQCQ